MSKTIIVKNDKVFIGYEKRYGNYGMITDGPSIYEDVPFKVEIVNNDSSRINNLEMRIKTLEDLINNLNKKV